ncbi:MAG TPA: DUF1559 domain-containing protein, partial [Chthonomonas sp.]|uniref:DUF1559 family PulG-like putative transporter n=1 Tax=Chthonomonas sp. TaxID=2282153 RepID=UPI002B4B4844
LAGILWVVFAPAREKARQSVCISNLHQIGVALSLYRSDYDGQEAMQGVPMTASQLGLPMGSSGSYTFDTAYVKDRRILYCPDFWLDPNISENQKKGLGSSYGWDYMCCDDPYPEAIRFSTQVAKKGNRAITVYCEEHNDFIPRSQLYKEPYWETKHEIVLRLNNQVQTFRVPIYSDLNDWP